MVAFDVVEDILLRSDVKDLVPWKRVCKSWYSLISSPDFVKTHLNNNDSSKAGLIRIVMPTFWNTSKLPNDGPYIVNVWKLVGSSNGLICVSRMLQDGLILVNNPYTREIRKVPMPPDFPRHVNGVLTFLSLSFGYDASTDDYKVVMGIEKSTIRETHFQVFSLKSNTWKTIGQFKHIFIHCNFGILFNGAFHWIGFDCNKVKTKKVILKFDLSREDFTIIPLPKGSKYGRRMSLGIVENQLYICVPDMDIDNHLPFSVFVMRGYNDEQSWERLPNGYEMKYQVAVHPIKMLEFSSPKQKRMTFFCDNNKRLSRAANYITAQIFTPSLVSPYVNSRRPSHPMNNKTIVNAWTIEVPIGESPDMQATTGDPFEASERIEKIYRLEVGEAENLYLHEDATKTKRVQRAPLTKHGKRVFRPSDKDTDSPAPPKPSKSDILKPSKKANLDKAVT